MTFLTPLGALFALLGLLPLSVLVLRERRARRVRDALGLAQPSPRAQLPMAVVLAAVAGLIGLAATQPVVQTDRIVRERTDVEAFVLVDVSRSMLAAEGPGAPTRLERARVVAERFRQALPQVPVGLLSLTDRVLPHLFPTTDATVFLSTLERAIGIERPPPALFFSTRATSLDALEAIPRRGFFSPRARKRVLVVLTDGESQELDADLRRSYRMRPAIESFFVHLWSANEGIYETGVAERGYRPDAASAGTLARVAALVGGRVFEESQARELAAAAKEVVGSGATRERTIEGERRALMPFITLAALLPLAFVLRRRNL